MALAGISEGQASVGDRGGGSVGRGSSPTQGKRRRNRAPVWPPLNGVPIPGFPHPGLDHGPSGIPALPPASCVTLGQLLGLSELQSMCL